MHRYFHFIKRDLTREEEAETADTKCRMCSSSFERLLQRFSLIKSEIFLSLS